MLDSWNGRAGWYERATVHAEFDRAELDRMRALLDNPELPRESRHNFLYALSNAGRLSDAEIDRYSAELGADAEDVRAGGQSIDENVANARESLSTADEDIWRTGADRTKENIERAQHALAQGGFSTSDEIIDQARLVGKLFEDFHPRYEKASDIVGGDAEHIPQQPVIPLDTVSFEEGGTTARAAAYRHTGIDPRSIRAGMDEFRGIEFSAFRTDAEMLSNAHGSVTEARDALDSAWSGNTADWTGGAKESATRVNDNLGKSADTLSEALRKAGDAIVHTTDQAIQPSVVNYAHQVLAIYGDGTIAQLTPLGVDDLINQYVTIPVMAEECRTRAADSFLFKSYYEKLVTELESARQEVKKTLAEFCSEYKAKAESVHGQGANFVSEIDQHYSTLLEFLNQGLPGDLFAAENAGETGAAQPQPAGIGGAGTGGAGTGGGGTGGAPAGVGGGGTGAGGGVPDMAEMTADTGAAGTNPVTGEALEVDPETGEPYPIDPRTGEAITDVGEQETLTVEKGDQTFTISEPNDEGEMGISVEDGSGELTDYRLDFDTVENAAGGEAGDFGPAGPAGNTGAAGSEGSAGDSGKIYRPGPDGKIHIEDGDLTITAERPEGPEGPTVVTVDNGDGEPTTYTLGSGETEGPLPPESRTSAPPDSAGAEQSPPERGSSSGVDTGDTGGGSGGGIPGTPETPVNGESTGASPAGGAGSPGADEAGAAAGAGEARPAESGPDRPDGATTTPQAVEGGGGGPAVGGVGGFDGVGGEDSGSGTQSGAGPSSTASTPSGAGLGTAPGGETAAPAAQDSGTSGGGMGMMGGMGGMGAAGGGQGGDQERSTNPYRVDGDIFEAAVTTARISGTIGEAADVAVRFSR